MTTRGISPNPSTGRSFWQLSTKPSGICADDRCIFRAGASPPPVIRFSEIWAYHPPCPPSWCQPPVADTSQRAALMLKTDASLSNEQHFVLSNLPPSSGQKRLALGIVLSLVIALYLVTGPFGGAQLGAIHSFVAIYTTAMFVTDCLTAILLYAQFSILRSRGI